MLTSRNYRVVLATQSKNYVRRFRFAKGFPVVAAGLLNFLSCGLLDSPKTGSGVPLPKTVQGVQGEHGTVETPARPRAGWQLHLDREGEESPEATLQKMLRVDVTDELTSELKQKLAAVNFLLGTQRFKLLRLPEEQLLPLFKFPASYSLINLLNLNPLLADYAEKKTKRTLLHYAVTAPIHKDGEPHFKELIRKCLTITPKDKYRNGNRSPSPEERERAALRRYKAKDATGRTAWDCVRSQKHQELLAEVMKELVKNSPVPAQKSVDVKKNGRLPAFMGLLNELEDLHEKQAVAQIKIKRGKVESDATDKDIKRRNQCNNIIFGNAQTIEEHPELFQKHMVQAPTETKVWFFERHPNLLKQAWKRTGPGQATVLHTLARGPIFSSIPKDIMKKHINLLLTSDLSCWRRWFRRNASIAKRLAMKDERGETVYDAFKYKGGPLLEALHETLPPKVLAQYKE